MTISFGVSPIAWINDDMPELGGDTPVETVLADARDIGFAGIELGGKFPRDPAALRSLLGTYELQLIGGWYSSNLLTRTAEEEIAAMQQHLSLLNALGRMRAHALMAFSTALLSVALSVILTRQIGITGPVLGSLAGHVLLAGLPGAFILSRTWRAHSIST